ncbi:MULTISPECIES: DUF4440 domain-containing protein [unclassified Sphingomonas]|uniref:YybH family protein n=1 Tax=unclassified Sphingomonas TaxID=196159 RepID=UPI00226A579E|nr:MULTISPECIES: DUF4440 domain-containing protein [unclassified Sphingomonas]
MWTSVVNSALGVFALLQPHAMPATLEPQRVGTAPAKADAELLAVIQSAIQAERTFDPGALAAVLAPDYIEVSPVGEVDRRKAVLGFYDPANRRNAPLVTINDPVTRRDGSNAIAIVQLAFSSQDSTPPRPPMLMRATFVMRRESTKWLIASAQFTPIRPAGQ